MTAESEEAEEDGMTDSGSDGSALPDPSEGQVDWDYAWVGAPGRHLKVTVSRLTAAGEREVLFVDTINPASAQSRVRFLRRLQELAPYLVENAEARLCSIAAQDRRTWQQIDWSELQQQRDNEAGERLRVTPPHVQKQAYAWLCQPGLSERLSEDLAGMHIVGEQTNALALYLVGVSRLLPKPLGAIVTGSSSSGKSYVIEQVAKMFPAESVIDATDLTPAALHYMEPGALLHSFIVLGERTRNLGAQAAEKTRALRELHSRGIITKVVTTRSCGITETTRIEQRGPVSYVESTTLDLLDVFREDLNRRIILPTDESPENTEAIKRAKADHVSGRLPDLSREIVERHHCIQRMLRRVTVEIPYASVIADHLCNKTESRRVVDHVFSAVKAVALVHQFQRVDGVPEHGQVIPATVEDYAIVRPLMMPTCASLLGDELTPAVRRFADWLVDDFHGEFTTTEVWQQVGCPVSKSQATDHLNRLAEIGVIELVKTRFGPRPAVWRAVGPVPSPGEHWLPTSEDVAAAAGHKGQRDA